MKKPAKYPRVLLLLFVIFFAELGFGQSAKYLVLFKDKVGSPFTITQPINFLSQRAINRRMKQGIAVTQRDLPVNPNYLAQIKQTGARVWYASKWINGALVEATTAQLATIQQLSFFKSIEFGKLLANARFTGQNDLKNKFGTQGLDYGSSVSQIQMLGVDKMHDKGYHGEGMLVGILDSGFKNSNSNSAMSDVFSENRVLATYDFVKNEKAVYEDDSHGNNVFSIMSGNLPGSLIGPAYKASYVLIRTEDANTETKLEEANWLFGAEYADSLGVDVINTSLGYTEFDNPTDNYSYANMDGKTTLITRAADWAAATGMVVVVANGNEGAAAWKYLSAPADANYILAVGAVNNAQIPASFTSFGPSADGRVKPDVSAQGVTTILSGSSNNVASGNGTSYSSPLIAGLVTGFWQAYPHLTALQVIDCIKKAGNLYQTPTTQLGYGIPTFERAAVIAQRDYPLLSCCLPFEAIKLYPNPVIDEMRLQFSVENIGQTFKTQIVSVNGQTLLLNDLKVNQVNQVLNLPTSLISGTYILTLSGDGLYQTLKFIKQ